MALKPFAKFKSWLSNLVTNDEYRDQFGLWHILYSNDMDQGYRNNDAIDFYRSSSWVYAAVFKISTNVGMQGWHFYRINRDNRKENVIYHPAMQLLKKPNQFTISMDLFALTQMYLDLLGGAYWVIETIGNKPAEIWVPKAYRMSIALDDQQYIKGFVYSTANKEGKEIDVPFTLDEVVYFHYPNPIDPRLPMSPLLPPADTIESDKYARKWNKTFFKNEARPDFAITIPHTLSDKAFRRLQQQWQERYGGVSKAHKVAILEQGGKPVTFPNISQKDMDFINLRNFSLKEVFTIYGISPYILGIAEDVNRASAQAAFYIFAKSVILPRLRWLETRINEDFIHKFYDENLYFEFDNPVSEDRTVMQAEARIGVSNGFLTINDGRKRVGADPVPGGDVFLWPADILPQTLTPTKSVNTNYLNAIRPIEDKYIREAKKILQNWQNDKISAEQMEQVLDNMQQEIKLALNLSDSKSIDTSNEVKNMINEMKNWLKKYEKNKAFGYYKSLRCPVIIRNIILSLLEEGGEIK